MTIHIDSDKATLARRCPSCGKEWSITVDAESYKAGIEKYRAGAMIQQAFPMWTPSQRELLLSGICDKCWQEMAEEFDEDIELESEH